MISIVVPIYNAALYLRECIESILNQSYTNFELILVNDGSKDDSLQICKSYHDSRIIIIDKENGGVSSARNKGIDIAKGEFIGFVDSDDTLPENALYILHQAIKENKTDTVIGTFRFQYGSRFIQHFQRLKKGIYFYEDILSEFIDDGTLSGFLIGSLCGALYRRDIIIDNKIRLVEGLKNNEDGLFNFEYALKAKSVISIPNIVYNYRQEEGSTLSIRKSENFGDRIFQYIDQIEWNRNLYKYDIQKKRRIVTLEWWNILHNYKDLSTLKSISFIFSCMSKKDVCIGLRYMEVQNMNVYKKYFYYLMKWRLSIAMFVSLKYVVPILEKRLIR